MDVSRKARFDGVFNGVQGDKEAVDALIEHPDVKGAEFVMPTAK